MGGRYESVEKAGFGLIRPNPSSYGSGVEKIIGGITKNRATIKGDYVSIGKLVVEIEQPEWLPDNLDWGSIKEVDLSNVPNNDEHLVPDNILSEGRFKSYKEYMRWSIDCPQYGHQVLYDDLRRFNYGDFRELEKDPRKVWGDRDSLWERINDELPFEYTIYDYYKYDLESYKYPFNPDMVPTPEPAIKWIKIEDVNDDCFELKGWENDYVILLCPNGHNPIEDFSRNH